MTRKRFRKLMMSMGLHKNNVNNHNPFTAWPFCVMPSICSYDYAWQLYVNDSKPYVVRYMYVYDCALANWEKVWFALAKLL